MQLRPQPRIGEALCLFAALIQTDRRRPPPSQANSRASQGYSSCNPSARAGTWSTRNVRSALAGGWQLPVASQAGRLWKNPSDRSAQPDLPPSSPRCTRPLCSCLLKYRAIKRLAGRTPQLARRAGSPAIRLLGALLGGWQAQPLPETAHAPEGLRGLPCPARAVECARRHGRHPARPGVDRAIAVRRSGRNTRPARRGPGSSSPTPRPNPALPGEGSN